MLQLEKARVVIEEDRKEYRNVIAWGFNRHTLRHR